MIICLFLSCKFKLLFTKLLHKICSNYNMICSNFKILRFIAVQITHGMFEHSKKHSKIFSVPITRDMFEHSNKILTFFFGPNYTWVRTFEQNSKIFFLSQLHVVCAQTRTLGGRWHYTNCEYYCRIFFSLE